MEEELSELQSAIASGNKAHTHEEFGDVLFSLVNYARFIDVNPEESLLSTIQKFNTRFQFIEKRLIEQGKDIHQTSLEEMDALWNEAKKK